MSSSNNDRQHNRQSERVRLQNAVSNTTRPVTRSTRNLNNDNAAAQSPSQAPTPRVTLGSYRDVLVRPAPASSAPDRRPRPQQQLRRNNHATYDENPTAQLQSLPPPAFQAHDNDVNSYHSAAHIDHSNLLISASHNDSQIGTAPDYRYQTETQYQLPCSPQLFPQSSYISPYALQSHEQPQFFDRIQREQFASSYHGQRQDTTRYPSHWSAGLPNPDIIDRNFGFEASGSYRSSGSYLGDYGSTLAPHDSSYGGVHDYQAGGLDQSSYYLEPTASHDQDALPASWLDNGDTQAHRGIQPSEATQRVPSSVAPAPTTSIENIHREQIASPHNQADSPVDERMTRSKAKRVKKNQGPAGVRPPTQEEIDASTELNGRYTKVANKAKSTARPKMKKNTTMDRDVKGNRVHVAWSAEEGKFVDKRGTTEHHRWKQMRRQQLLESMGLFGAPGHRHLYYDREDAIQDVMSQNDLEDTEPDRTTARNQESIALRHGFMYFRGQRNQNLLDNFWEERDGSRLWDHYGKLRSFCDPEFIARHDERAVLGDFIPGRPYPVETQKGAEGLMGGSERRKIYHEGVRRRAAAKAAQEAQDALAGVQPVESPMHAETSISATNTRTSNRDPTQQPVPLGGTSGRQTRSATSAAGQKRSHTDCDFEQEQLDESERSIRPSKRPKPAGHRRGQRPLMPLAPANERTIQPSLHDYDPLVNISHSYELSQPFFDPASQPLNPTNWYNSFEAPRNTTSWPYAAPEAPMRLSDSTSFPLDPRLSGSADSVDSPALLYNNGSDISTPQVAMPATPAENLENHYDWSYMPGVDLAQSPENHAAMQSYDPKADAEGDLDEEAQD